uniref:Elongation factor Ts n=1 Tax=Rhizophora mucronata TaxID=61149 RepID=A0A2P2L6Y4_RHIMU
MSSFSLSSSFFIVSVTCPLVMRNTRTLTSWATCNDESPIMFAKPSLDSSDVGRKPSSPSGRDIKAPALVIFLTVPFSSCPLTNFELFKSSFFLLVFDAFLLAGLGLSLLEVAGASFCCCNLLVSSLARMLREIRPVSILASINLTFTSCPTDTKLPTSLTKLSLNLETCTRPSVKAPKSTKAPNGWIDFTFPVNVAPTMRSSFFTGGISLLLLVLERLDWVAAGLKSDLEDGSLFSTASAGISEALAESSSKVGESDSSNTTPVPVADTLCNADP